MIFYLPYKCTLYFSFSCRDYFNSPNGWLIYRHPKNQAKIFKSNPINFSKFNSSVYEYKVFFKTIRKNVPIYKIGMWNDELVNATFLKLLDDLNITLNHHNPLSEYNITLYFVENCLSFSLPFRKISSDKINLNDIISNISNLTQSNNTLNADCIIITVKVVDYVVGHSNDMQNAKIPLKRTISGAHLRSDYLDADPNKKNCVFLSVAYAVLSKQKQLGQLKDSEAQALNNRSGKKVIQKKGIEIAQKASLQYDNCIAGYNELLRIEEVIPFKLTVYQIVDDGDNSSNNGKPYASLFYNGKQIKNGVIYLALYNTTYLALVRPGVILLNFCKVCPMCGVIHSKKQFTNCVKLCSSCWTVECKAKAETMPITLCPDCNLYFKGSECLNWHKKKGKCQKIKHCIKCGVQYVHHHRNPHTCHLIHCATCHVKYDPRTNEKHVCFMRPLKNIVHKNKVRTYFDYKTIVDEEGKFLPVNISSLTMCNYCTSKVTANTDFKCDFCTGLSALKTFLYDNSHENISLNFIQYLYDMYDL